MRWVGVFLSAKGGLGRKGFWLGALVLGLMAAALLLLGPVGRASALLLLVPLICLFSKRLHDLGKSGWFSAVPCGFAAVGALAVRFTSEAVGVHQGVTFGGLFASLACAIVGLTFFIRVGLAKPDLDPSAYSALLAAPEEAEAREAA